MVHMTEAVQASAEQGRSRTPFDEAIAGLSFFFSSALRELVDGLEAGTEEGVRIAVEKFEEDAKSATEIRIQLEKTEAERKRVATEEQEQEKRSKAEESRKQDEKNRATRQKIRDKKTSFWTTPGQRPLAEPPILDWDWFFRDHIPSDLRYAALFPNDPEKRCRIKDLHGEKAALHEYSHCAALTRDSLKSSERQEFYADLIENLVEDWKEVDAEFAETFNTAARLAQFEFRRLDNDGKTTRLEHWLDNGADILAGEPDDVRNKYRYLMPAGFMEDPLATFNYLHEDGATDMIKQQMEKGNDVLIGWPQEVQERYGYLRRFLPPDDTQLARSSSRNRWHLPPALTSSSGRHRGSQQKGKISVLDISLVARVLQTSRSESTTLLTSSPQSEERKSRSITRPA